LPRRAERLYQSDCGNVKNDASEVLNLNVAVSQHISTPVTEVPDTIGDIDCPAQ